MPVTYISWAASCSRSDHTARELGGRSHMVYSAALGSHPATVVLKYLLQGVRTLRILLRERPSAVFVMTPPVIAALPVWLYCRAAGIPYVLDAHTAAFLHPRWTRLQWLQRWLTRGAATTLVTNPYLAQLVERGGGHATIVRDVPILFAPGAFPRATTFTVAMVCSFNDDEPVAAMFQAAARLPDVTFYVTGNPRHLKRETVAAAPANLHLTGFLSTADYGDLVTRADAVMTLTTRDHTMLRAAYEAIYQGTPVVVSDWPVLREAFDEGAVHVDNSVDAIVAAVRTLQANHAAFAAAATRLRGRKLADFETVRAEIIRRIAPPAAHAAIEAAR